MKELNFPDFETFCEWFKTLNPSEPVDKHEAMTIYFNLETYGEQFYGIT